MTAPSCTATRALVRQRLGRRPAREGLARRRRREPAQGHRQGDRLLRRRDRGRRRDVERRPHRLPPERRGGGGRPPAWHAVVLSWSPEATFVVDPEWRGVVLMTRDDPPRARPAWCCRRHRPVACPACSPPAAAGEGVAADRRRPNDVLNFSNWPLYIDFDEKTKKHPTLDAVHRRRPGSRSTTTRTSTTTRPTSPRCRAHSRRARASTGTSSSSPTTPATRSCWSTRRGSSRCRRTRSRTSPT